MAVGAVELAHVSFALVLASGDGFGTRAVMLVATGVTLRRAQGGDE
jgi:hypothetical protein